MDDEIEGSVKFAFSWRKLDFKGVYAALVILGLVPLLFQSLVSNYNYRQFSNFLFSPAGILVLLAGIAVFLFLYAWIELLLISMALKGRKLKARSFAAIDYAKFVVLGIAVFFASAFSVFNFRGLALLGLAVLTGVLAWSDKNFTLGLIAFFFLMGYFIVAAYNFIRLSQTQYFFAMKNKGLVGAMKDSLDATLGNVLWLVLVGVVVSIPVFIVGLLAAYLPAAMAGLVAGGGFNGLYARLVVTLLMPVLTISLLFAFAGVFSFLLKRKKSKVAWKF